MNEIIDNDEANSGLPNDTVLRGAIPGGDSGAMAVRRHGQWVFLSRHGGLRPAVIDRLCAGPYEVLYRPEPPPAKVGYVVRTEKELDRLPCGTMALDLNPNLKATASSLLKDDEGDWVRSESMDDQAWFYSDELAETIPAGVRIVHIPSGVDA